MNTHPSGNGTDGRDPKTGQFIKGWKGGPGNPIARRTAEYHRAIRDAVGPDAVVEIMFVLIKKALEGDVIAAREVLDRILGKAKVTMAVQEPQPTIEELRARLLAQLNRDPHMLHRALGLPLRPVIDSRESEVAG